MGTLLEEDQSLFVVPVIIGNGASATFHKQKGAHQCVFHMAFIRYKICTFNVFAICTYQSKVEYVKKIAKHLPK